MKRLIILVLVIVSYKQLTAAENYIEYHRKVIQAQNLFLSGSLKASTDKYKEIFTSYKKPFVKDCFIAAQIACLRKDTAYAKYFLEKAFMHGLNWKWLFDVEPVRELVINNRQFEKNLREVYESARKKYLSSIDTALRFKIRKLILKDGYYKVSIAQKYRNESRDTTHWIIGDSLYAKTLDENLVEIKNIIKKVGYPGEHMIGVWDAETDKYLGIEDVLSDDLYKKLCSVTSLMFYHHEYGYQFLHKELLQAVKDGEMSPGEYALIHEWSYNSIDDSEKLREKYGKMASYKTSKSVMNYHEVCDVLPRDCRYNLFINWFHFTKDTVLVDNCRKEIGMYSLMHDTMLKKFERDNNLQLHLGFFERF